MAVAEGCEAAGRGNSIGMRCGMDVDTNPAQITETRTQNHRRYEDAFTAAVDRYRWGTRSCRSVISALLGAKARLPSGRTSKYYRVVRGLNAGRYAARAVQGLGGLLAFIVIERADGRLIKGVKRTSSEQFAIRLLAPDLFGLAMTGGPVPLPPDERTYWKAKLERWVDLREYVPDDRLPLIPDPAEQAAMSHVFWRWFMKTRATTKKPQIRQLATIYAMAKLFRNRWVASVPKHRQRLPCAIRASDTWLAKALDISVSKARQTRILLEEGGIVRKCSPCETRKGTYWDYLPGTGTPVEWDAGYIPDQAKETNYRQPLVVLRSYQRAFGLENRLRLLRGTGRSYI